MLTSRPIMPVLPVTDLERARRFYSDRLGLRPSGERSAQDAVVLEAGHGTKLELLKRDQPTKAEHTALTFEVDDIDHEVAELEGRGVRFEDYNTPSLKTERHIAKMDGERAAWFKDTEGNILCIHQRVARG
jgi:catechol 2,3-dioxygenase-like lactoylglutathione lyase family enzyme